MALDRLGTALANLFEINGQHSAGLNAVVVAAVLLAVAGVGYTVASPENTQQYTEFYLLAENESGELVAQDYPESIEADQPTAFHVGVGNNLGERTEYSVVVKLQRMYFENETPEVLEEEVVGSANVTVPADEREVRSVNVTPGLRGSEMRLRFLLYRGDPPAQPSVGNAYHETHLWLNVTTSTNASDDLG